MHGSSPRMFINQVGLKVGRESPIQNNLKFSLIRKNMLIKVKTERSDRDEIILR